MKDKYDEAVEYLTQNPTKILDAWHHPHSQTGGCLFVHAGRRFICGCLTQIRKGIYDAETPALTAAIRADGRIPVDVAEITVASLPVFTEWQRRLDKELNRAEVGK